MPRRTWKYLLPAGILFHVSIALMMGLLSFSIAMAGALILYLRPADQAFLLSSLRRLLHHWPVFPEPVRRAASPMPAPLASRSGAR
jgi:hypothetical protein